MINIYLTKKNISLYIFFILKIYFINLKKTSYLITIKKKIKKFLDFDNLINNLEIT